MAVSVSVRVGVQRRATPFAARFAAKHSGRALS